MQQADSPQFWSGVTDILRAITPFLVMAVLGFLYRIEKRLVRVELTVGVDGTNGIYAKVKSLHDWRSEMQRRELEQALEENKRLHERLDG